MTLKNVINQRSPSKKNLGSRVTKKMIAQLEIQVTFHRNINKVAKLVLIIKVNKLLKVILLLTPSLV